MSEQEIQKLADWAKAGAPEGDSKDLQPPPKFPEGWQLGTPDLVLKVAEPFTVPAEGTRRLPLLRDPDPDRFGQDGLRRRVPAGQSQGRAPRLALPRQHRGRPGARRRSDPGPGYASFGGPGILPTGGLGGWAPGAMPRFLPDGIGKFLRKGSDLVLQIHYHPDGKPETDQSVVGIYFTRTPARKIVAGIAVRTRNLDIPPGEPRHHVTAQSQPLPVDVQVIGITPHMHYIGKEMKVVAQTPDGKTIPLIWIKDWDFNWQGQYQYTSAVQLPKGSVIKLDAYYDNSEANPSNPSRPPKRVRWGEQTTDEMCLLGVQVVTDNLADLRKVIAMRGNGFADGLLGRAGTPRPGRLQSEGAERRTRRRSARSPSPSGSRRSWAASIRMATAGFRTRKLIPCRRAWPSASARPFSCAGEALQEKVRSGQVAASSRSRTPEREDRHGRSTRRLAFLARGIVDGGGLRLGGRGAARPTVRPDDLRREHRDVHASDRPSLLCRSTTRPVVEYIVNRREIEPGRRSSARPRRRRCDRTTSKASRGDKKEEGRAPPQVSGEVDIAAPFGPDGRSGGMPRPIVQTRMSRKQFQGRLRPDGTGSFR